MSVIMGPKIVYEDEEFKVERVHFPNKIQNYFTYMDEENTIGNVSGKLEKEQIQQICNMIEQAYEWGRQTTKLEVMHCLRRTK